MVTTLTSDGPILLVHMWAYQVSIAYDGPLTGRTKFSVLRANVGVVRLLLCGSLCLWTLTLVLNFQTLNLKSQTNDS